jgi:hypothetical protein
MINGVHEHSFRLFLRFDFADYNLLTQNIGLIPITIQDPQIQNPNLMHLIHIKLMRPQIAGNIMTLHKLLQRSMLRLECLQITRQITQNGNFIYHLFVIEGWMVELDVGCGGHLVEAVGVQQVGGYFAGGRLPA